MTYLPTIPAPTDRLSKSQQDIRTNFTVLNDVFNNNHIPFTNTVNPGKHTHVDMLAQAAPVTAAGEGSLYAFNTGGTRDQLRYRRESNGAIVPLTEWIGAFAVFTWNNGTGVITILKQLNVASITHTGGLNPYFTITFTQAMADTNYVIHVQNINRTLSEIINGASNIAVDSFRSTQSSFSTGLNTYHLAVFGEIS